VEKILGAHKPEQTFDGLSFDRWKRAVIDQLTKSRLQDAIKRLVIDMVLSSHRRVLKEDGARLYKQLRQAISNQQFVADALNSSFHAS
jgi:hypothetical protein